MFNELHENSLMLVEFRISNNDIITICKEDEQILIFRNEDFECPILEFNCYDLQLLSDSITIILNGFGD